MDDKNFMKVFVGGSELSAALYAHLASVAIKDSIENLDSATITFALPEAIWATHSPNDFDWYGKEWKIITMAKGAPSKIYGGDIVGLNWQRSGGAPCMLTLTCIDHLHRLKKARKSSKANDRRFKSKTEASTIVKKVAQDWGLSPGTVEATELQCDEFEWKSDDATLLKKLADDSGSIVRLDFEGKKVNFTKGWKAVGSAPKVTLEFGVQILDIQGAHDLTTAVSKVSLTAVNKVKESASVKGEADAAKVEALNDKTMVAAKLVERMGGVLVDEEYKSDKGGAVDQSVLQGLAKGRITEASAKFVNGQMTTIFRPDIVAGCEITVEKAGWPLDGKFIANEVTHSFDTGGYRTQVNFTANSIAKPTTTKSAKGTHIASAVKK